MDCTEGAKTLTSCFVPTFVWYPDEPKLRWFVPEELVVSYPFLFAVEIRFHQPKQRLTVSLIFSGETLNSAEKKSHRSSYTLRRQLLENLQTQCHIFDKEVFYKRCILCGDYQETQDTRKISKHIKRERMRVIWTVIGRTRGGEAKLFQLIS